VGAVPGGRPGALPIDPPDLSLDGGLTRLDLLGRQIVVDDVQRQDADERRAHRGHRSAPVLRGIELDGGEALHDRLADAVGVCRPAFRLQEVQQRAGADVPIQFDARRPGLVLDAGLDAVGRVGRHRRPGLSVGPVAQFRELRSLADQEGVFGCHGRRFRGR
jgi:hypothetical protein